ncbi:MAG: peptidylprolyl isomerase [Candidatus Obscuribacterales bacterium]|nr:peptidylprolyl isomerase [Candidatus Obscuribacterales bacterium]
MNHQIQTKLFLPAAFICTLSLISACSQGPKTDTLSDKKNGVETSEQSTADKAGDNSSTAPTTVETAKETTATSATAPAPAPAGKVKINLNELPSTTSICIVGGNEIKVGDYKRMLKLQQLQMNQSFATNPALRMQLLKEADKHNVVLTAEEQKKLLDSAHKQQAANPKEFKAFLAKNKVTEKQFDAEVLQNGRAFKTSNLLVEQGLLPEMVNRELLVQAAEKAGMKKEAEKKYDQLKNLKDFQTLVKQSQLPSSELHQEIVKAELAKLQITKLSKAIKVSDSDLKKVYDENKEHLKHGERMRMSMIVVGAPTADIGQIKSIRSQLKAANPSLSDKQLDETSTQALEAAKQKALIILGRVKGGEDFAKVANETTDDARAKANKTGGDMGWVDKQNMVPELVKALSGLKAGEVLPQIVKSEIGYMIYKVNDIQKPGYISFTEVKPLLEAEAKQKKMQTTVNGWLNDQKKTVKIEFTPQFVALANNTGVKVADPLNK